MLLRLKWLSFYSNRKVSSCSLLSCRVFTLAQSCYQGPFVVRLLLSVESLAETLCKTLHRISSPVRLTSGDLSMHLLIFQLKKHAGSAEPILTQVLLLCCSISKALWNKHFCFCNSPEYEWTPQSTDSDPSHLTGSSLIRMLEKTEMSREVSPDCYFPNMQHCFYMTK